MSSINLALGTEVDLKQDLMNVLLHEDAKWGAEDFDFEVAQPVVHPAPQFLQPDHQPQLRLPSISSSWHPDHIPSHIISSAVWDSYGEPHRLGYQGYHDPNSVQSTNNNWQSYMQTLSFPIS